MALLSREGLETKQCELYTHFGYGEHSSWKIMWFEKLISMLIRGQFWVRY
jgi:hypothetical protein